MLWHQDYIGNKIIPFKFFVLFNKENIFGDSNNTFTYKVQKSMVYGMWDGNDKNSLIFQLKSFMNCSKQLPPSIPPPTINI